VNLFFAIFLGILGLAVGIATPFVSDKIILYKCTKSEKQIPIKPFWKWYSRGIPVLLNAAFWSLAALKLSNPFGAVLISILVSVSVLFAVVDYQIHIIPNEMILVTLVIGGLFQVVQFGLVPFLIAIGCMFGMMLLFLIVGFIVGMGKVGAGDIKLAGVMGLALGYPAIMNAALVMSIVIFLYCFFGIWFRKLTMVSFFAFAPFMMIGMISALGLIIF